MKISITGDDGEVIYEQEDPGYIDFADHHGRQV
jgi:hypothetical protein